MQASAGRQGVGKTELALPGISARASPSQARPGRGRVDEADRHVDGQNGKTLAGFCEGLHNSYVQGAVGVTPADNPAGAATVGAPDDQLATPRQRAASAAFNVALGRIAADVLL